MCRYLHYLESVLEASEGYHEVGDLIARQTTLDSTHADLETRLAASAAAAEAVRCRRAAVGKCAPASAVAHVPMYYKFAWRRTDLQRYRKAKADELVNLNNSVAVLKEQLERIREESRATDVGSRTRAAVTAKYKMEHGQVC